MPRFLKIALLAIPLAATYVCAQGTGFQIDSLTYEISMYGDVILKWTPPQGAVVARYYIYRKEGGKQQEIIAILNSSTVRQYTDRFSNVVPGKQYNYLLEAQDISGNFCWKDINVVVTPPVGAMNFTSVPPTTALLDSTYLYFPTADAGRQEDIEFSFSGQYPEGMFLSSVAGGRITRLDWTPRQVGQYKITLVARHKVTHAVGIQEFTIVVTNTPGTVLGFVRTLDNTPVPDCLVRVFQVANAMTYETKTDSTGTFILNNVQAGEIFAYARAGSDRFAPQWYSLGNSMADVSARTLKPRDTLSYEFYLLTATDQPTQVSGIAREVVTGVPIQYATVSFIRKNSFIHIGDRTTVSNPSFLEDYSIEASAQTDAAGRFVIDLKVGMEYYVVVEHKLYSTRFNPEIPNVNPTNALEARPFKVRDGVNLLFEMQPAVPTMNRIVGTIRNETNGITKPAVVVLIDPELSRGAGGGNTYRRYSSTISDQNGSYSFDNLSENFYSVLAVPLDRKLAPQYFTYGGGSSVAINSASIKPDGTVQNIDFDLQPTEATGVGTIYGQVMILKNGRQNPGVGTLVFAEDTATKAVYGYAVADSAGWYSIPGLPSGSYVLYAENLNYGSDVSPRTPLLYTSYNLFTSTKVVNFLINAEVTAVDPVAAPHKPTLYQNYPNPFNPATTISYYLPVRGAVSLTVFNALGEEIAVLANGETAGGMHRVEFDASSLPSGVYYYRLKVGTTVLSNSMLLLK